MRLVLMIILFLPVFAGAATPFVISENPGSGPAVAAWADSQVVVVFGVGDQVVFTIPGVVSESPLAPPGADTGSSTDVVARENSGFVAVWLASDGVRSRPVARIFDQDGMPETGLLEIGGSGDAADIAVTSAPGGGFVVTWSGFGPPGSEHVFARVYDAAGQPVTAGLRVSDDEDVHNIHPHVASAPDGSFTITWGTFNTLSSTARARRHSGPGGNWDGSWLVADNAAYPSIAADEFGNNLLVWSSTLGKQAIWGGLPDEVPSILGGSATGPAGMARHYSGAGAAVWHEGGTGVAGQLRARIFDGLGQPLGDVINIADNVMGEGNAPGVAVSKMGRVIFVWVDHATGLVHGNWGGEPIVPVATKGWGSLKGIWR